MSGSLAIYRIRLPRILRRRQTLPKCRSRIGTTLFVSCIRHAYKGIPVLNHVAVKSCLTVMWTTRSVSGRETFSASRIRPWPKHTQSRSSPIISPVPFESERLDSTRCQVQWLLL